MREFVYIAPSFTREESISAILSIRLTTGGHCFSVRRDKEVLMLFAKDVVSSSDEEQMEHLYKSLEQHNLRSLSFSSVNIFHANGYKMLIPQSEVKAGREKIWLKTLGEPLSGDDIVSSLVEPCDALLFSSQPSCFYELKGMGELGSIQNIAASFITNSILSVPSKHRGHWIFVEYSRGVVDIVVTKGQKLLFYNCYNAKQSEEVLFYVLQVMKLHGLDDKPNAVFSGETMCGDDMIYATLRRYIPSFVLAANVMLKEICSDSNIEAMSKFVHML